MIGVRPDGTKELIAVEDGYRESAESWKTVLRDLKRRGMHAPMVAVGDGALGFWAAVREVWPKTCAQRDWFHKLGNILDKLPRRLQPRVKAALQRTKGLLMAYKLLDIAQARWRRIDGAHLLPLVQDGVASVDGVEQVSKRGKPRARAA
jgi:transposase-like protein